MMDALMSETCWAHKKWNKIASDIKLVFCSSANIRIFSHPPQHKRMRRQRVGCLPTARYCQHIESKSPPRYSSVSFRNVQKCACVFRPVSSSMCFSHTFTAIFPESVFLKVINNFNLVEMNGSFEYGTCSIIAPYRVPSQDLSKCLIQNNLIYFGIQKMDIWQVIKFIMINHTPVLHRLVS